MNDETNTRIEINGVTVQLPSVVTVTTANGKQYVMGLGNNQPVYHNDREHAWEVDTAEGARRLWGALMTAKVDPNSVGWEAV